MHCTLMLAWLHTLKVKHFSSVANLNINTNFTKNWFHSNKCFSWCFFCNANFVLQTFWKTLIYEVPFFTRVLFYMHKQICMKQYFYNGSLFCSVETICPFQVNLVSLDTFVHCLEKYFGTKSFLRIVRKLCAKRI